MVKVARALLSSPADVEPSLEETVTSLRGQSVNDAQVFGALRRACAARDARRTSRVPGAAVTEPSGEAAAADRARRLLAKLRPTEREALVLKELGQLSIADVAIACGVDEATGRARISRALVAISGFVAEEG
jgi:RNA polymerase sigma-70 factor (ECF subfamily)